MRLQLFWNFFKSSAMLYLKMLKAMMQINFFLILYGKCWVNFVFGIFNCSAIVVIKTNKKCVMFMSLYKYKSYKNTKNVFQNSNLFQNLYITYIIQCVSHLYRNNYNLVYLFGVSFKCVNTSTIRYIIKCFWNLKVVVINTSRRGLCICYIMVIIFLKNNNDCAYIEHYLPCNNYQY